MRGPPVAGHDMEIHEMNSRQGHRTLAALGAALALALPALGQADEHGRFDGPHGGWHGDIHHFHEHDLEVWRGGRWLHGSHEGRFGWWWLVAGAWYFYPTPVYPYPDPYQPPVPMVVAPEPAAPPHYYYYCGNPAGYYPYVPRCVVPWQRMVSPPPQPVPQVAPEGVPPPPQ